MSKELLAELNAFRTNEGKDAFKDWRKARHQPMLDTYRAAAEFEAPAEEIASQIGRTSADIARDEALITNTIVANQIPFEKVIANVVKVIPVKGGQIERAPDDKKGATGPSYKEMVRHEKSTVEKPFTTVHAFLDANPALGRKAAVAALVDLGINFYTARTQYQRWFQKNKKA